MVDKRRVAAGQRADAETEALASALAQVGDRWTLRIVHTLLSGPQRFGQLQRDLGVAPNVLTGRLRTLEADGVVLAEPYQQRPPRYSYRLTSRGRELAGVLRLLAAWAVDDRAPRHEVCGTDLEVRWWCPTCERPAGEPDDEVVRM